MYTAVNSQYKFREIIFCFLVNYYELSDGNSKKGMKFDIAGMATVFLNIM